jgi:methionyl-tRNA formyltransferase
MKIVLFGEDIFTAAALQSIVDDGHVVDAVICPLYPDNFEYRSLEKSAKKNDISFFHQQDINDAGIRDYLQKTGPDLVVSVHLRKLLMKEIYSVPALGSINVHPSLLPKYRGLSPQHQALIHGDSETGVTIHFMDEAADTGDIILQEKIPLTKEIYIYDLQMKLLQVYKQLIPAAIKTVSKNDFKPIKQNKSGGSWFGRLKDSGRKIDLKKAKFAIYNLVRAVSKPYKGAYFNDITVWRCIIPDTETEKMYLKEFTDTGIYKIQDMLLIRLHDGVLLSDDFEIAIT